MTPVKNLSATQHIVLLSVFTLVTVACDEMELESVEDLTLRQATLLPGDPGSGVWINNGLHDPDVSGVDPAFGLASPEGLAADSELLLDPDRRNTVRYMVECALPAGHGITKQVGDELLAFDGSMGLAPEWEDGECDEDCQEWVSACLLARTNVSGKSVAIWMRADHPAIGDGTNPAYPAYEASFFGNLFAASDSQYYCEGSKAGTLMGELVGRTCTQSEACGFTKYANCAQAQRCVFPLAGHGDDAAPNPVGCTAGRADTGPAFHTISTYLGQ
jgi:hypothetical protein